MKQKMMLGMLVVAFVCVLIPMHRAGAKVTTIKKDGVVFSEDGTVLMKCPTSKEGTYVVPEGVREIGEQAFYGCKKINEINISSKVEKIDVGAFAFTSIETFSISPENENFSVVDGVLYNKKGTMLKAFPFARTTYNVPAAVKSLSYLRENKISLKLSSYTVEKENKTFYAIDGVLFAVEHQKLYDYPVNREGVYTVPVSTTRIDTDAFYNAQKITKLVITKSVDCITKGHKFNLKRCPKLKELTLRPGHLSSLYLYTDKKCKLKKISLPTTVIKVTAKSLPRKVKVYGWDQTGAKEMAKRFGGTYVRLGKVLHHVTGLSAKKVGDRYKISWNKKAGANGYLVTTSDLDKIAQTSRTAVYISGDYNNEVIYVRAYQIKGKKKILGRICTFYLCD